MNIIVQTTADGHTNALQGRGPVSFLCVLVSDISFVACALTFLHVVLVLNHFHQSKRRKTVLSISVSLSASWPNGVPRHTLLTAIHAPSFLERSMHPEGIMASLVLGVHGWHHPQSSL